MKDAELALDLLSDLWFREVDELPGHYCTAAMLYLVNFAKGSSSQLFRHSYVLLRDGSKLQLGEGF